MMTTNTMVNDGAKRRIYVDNYKRKQHSMRLITTLSLAVSVILVFSSACLSTPMAVVEPSNRSSQKEKEIAFSSSRFRRQDSAVSTAAPPASLASSPGDDTNSSGGEQEEALASFKCDFGSSDQVDLCSFKVLPKQPGIGGKSGPTWSHGSGKLALYQGGPLVDSSRNDSSGGYIFYETSNPYVGQAGNNFSMISFASTSNNNNDALIRQDNPYHYIYGRSGQQDQSGVNRLLHQQQQQPHGPIGASPYQPVTSGSISVVGGLSSTSFVSPNLTAPGPSGMCLSFQYIIHGLSAEELIIHVNDHKSERSRQIWSSSESAQNNWTLGEVLYSVANAHSVSFGASNSMHAPKDLQQRKFRGYIALDEVTVAKHDPQQNQGACRGHCNFDGDLCAWTNAENGPEDDFDWSFGRGSDNLFTGPPRDYISSTNNGLTGSYLFTDSAYPRHPGDRAVLISPLFQPTTINEAMCMRFAVHMFGSGIGTLAIKIRYSEASGTGDNKNANDMIIWEMTGDAGNNWHQAQTSVSSNKQPFQVIIEGTIGENHLGNIAIDEISFSSGACPTSPPVASKNYGDCTFEQSMCYWKNSEPDTHLDDLDWVRSGDEQTIHGPNFDHTLKKRFGYYLKLENTYREPKSGTRAFLLSPVFQPRNNAALGNNVQCLSFYYYMFLKSVSPSGPNLGTIRVYLATNSELIPIWRLTNPITSPNWKQARAMLSITSVDGQPVAPTKFFQIAFEGVWGDAASGAIAIDDITIFDGACDILPQEAKSVAGECSFDADMCSWSNKTFEAANNDYLIDSSKSPFFQSVNSQQQHTSGNNNNNNAKQQTTTTASKRSGWQLATVDLRPVNLQDHTYKAPIGYAFVDILDSGAMATQSFILQGAEVSVGEGQQVAMCLSFWFAGFGRSDSNRLSVYLSQASQQQLSSADNGAGSAGPGGAGGSTGSGPPTATSIGQRNNQQSGNSISSAGSISGNNQQSASGSASSGSSSGPNPSSSIAALNSGQSGQSNQNGAVINSNLDSLSSNNQGDELDPGAWRMAKGQLLWSISLRNITEVNRRKWLYGQMSIKADSNFIIRYEASSSDGGFALDDISFYEGTCETRPAQAKVYSSADDQTNDSRSP